MRDLDIERPGSLEAYLRATGRIRPDEHPEIRTLAGGVSNKTVLITRAGGEAWVCKQALAKLRVAVDWFSDPARIEREALGIEHLSRLAPGFIPPLVFFDPEHFLLAMRAVPQPHENWKTMLLRGDLVPEHVEQFGRLLGTIHLNASRCAGELASVFAERRFFETLRLEPYYRFAATQVPQSASFYADLLERTRERWSGVPHCLSLVHGDYSPKNILVHEGRLVLLDHEVIHWGDPSFDLGFALAHFLAKALHVPLHRADFQNAARQFVDTHAATIGDCGLRDGLAEMTVRHTLGCVLARVAGRSPLEYLTPAERALQRELVVCLLDDLPATPHDLFDAYFEGMELAGH
jgi:tRNA A-37 threonylcarbamoyl transferase component Bud32